VTPRPEARLAARGGAVELLRVPAALFGAAARLRGALYDRSLLPVGRLEAPVVCVGNLTAGGTGKTPAVVWVARRLLSQGRRVGLLSRGYKSGGDAANDEARLLARLLPDVPHVQDPDRVAGGHALVAAGCDVVVMDDGFQHRRLARDLDLVLVDATRPWGLPPPPDGGAPVRALLPRGLLREPPVALRRASAVVLTRVDQADRAALDALREEVSWHAPGVPLAEAVHRPARLIDAAGREAPLAALSGAEVTLVSGIGNPDAFEATIRALGARVAEHRRFPDHHDYEADTGILDDLAAKGDAVVTTAKDLVKLGGRLPAARSLEVELEVVSGEAVLLALLEALRPGRLAGERAALHGGLSG
jgi:tetraacyldisaccharide 4'-kinase